MKKMPKIKVAKTPLNITDVKLAQLQEDRLIIKKDSDTFGRIYFDYNDETRIEIRSLNVAYRSDLTLNHDESDLHINNLHEYGSDENSIVNFDNIFIGSLVVDAISENIGIIVYKDNDRKKVKVKTMYSKTYLTWNDYFKDEFSDLDQYMLIIDCGDSDDSDVDPRELYFIDAEGSQSDNPYYLIDTGDSDDNM